MTDAIPTREECVLRYVLDAKTQAAPKAVFAKFEDGEVWTYAEMRARTRRLGAALQALRIGEGDHVVVWLPNGKPALEAYFAIGYIGAVYVPVNTAYRGDLLAHVLDNSDARLIIAHPDLIPRLREVETAALETVVSTGPEAVPVEGLESLPYEAVLTGAGRLRELTREIEPWDTQAVIYTSGTTGPSKGVLSSYLHNYAGMHEEIWICVGADDRYMINMPMFHIGGCFIVNAMLCRGASIAMTEGFRTDSFWQIARDTESTVVFLLGAMTTFLLKAPATDDDKDHPLKTVFIVPFTEDAIGFGGRFGVDTYTIFNMTEISTPLISPPNPTEAGYCGRARDGVTLRVVDENDIEVPPGTIGQLIIRTDQPWAMNHGYYNNPAATVEAWRNGWFHTRDAFRMNEAGEFFYVARFKDAIRRRGENISSIEVETQVNAHPAVQESAAVAVPSEFGEDEVLVILAPKPGQSVEPAELIEFLIPRMAHFMVPRYIRIMDELPKTPTTKVQKAPLRAEGLTVDTWDREAAGLKVKAARLS